MSEPRTQPHRLIVPVLKARIPVDLQLEFPLPPDDAPICEPLAGDVYISYVLDYTERYEYVTPRRRTELGLSPEAMREQATANLRNRGSDLTVDWSPDVKVVSITVGGGHEAPSSQPAHHPPATDASSSSPARRPPSTDASLVLDDELTAKLAQDVDGDLVVAVPARDVFRASGTGHEDGLAELRRTVDRVWCKGAPGPGEGEERLLTRDLLVRRGDAWEVLAT
jgi:hypothetical protein